MKIRAKNATVSGSAALFLGLVSAAPAANAVSAADGVNFYLGLHGGALFGDGRTYDAVSGIYDTTNASIPLLGVLGGVTVRNDGWFYGLEADVGLALDGDVASPCPDFNDICKISANGHLRGRIGRSFGNVDLFIAGGLAVARATINVDFDPFTRTLTGYSIGAGGEMTWTDGSRVRIELLHDRYGSHGFNSGYGVRNWSDFTARAAAIFDF